MNVVACGGEYEEWRDIVNGMCTKIANFKFAVKGIAGGVLG